jgi:hypothetical protein
VEVLDPEAVDIDTKVVEGLIRENSVSIVEYALSSILEKEDSDAMVSKSFPKDVERVDIDILTDSCWRIV